MTAKSGTPKPDSLGQFEQLVLTAILMLRDEAYGVPIHDKVTELADRRINMGSLYVTLDRLERKHLVFSWLSRATVERRGKPKRFYRLEPDGLRALEESVATSKRVAGAFDDSWSFRKWKPKRVMR